MPLNMRSGEKGFEPLTSGFGDHYSTIKTILLSRDHEPTIGVEPITFRLQN
jgi:hypothetical protein